MLRDCGWCPTFPKRWSVYYLVVRSWLPRFWQQVVAATGVFAAVVSVAAVGEVRAWFLDHAALGWYVALAASLLAIALWARGDYRGDPAQSPLEPSPRDRYTWSQLRSLLDWTSPTMRFLSDGFTGKQWLGRQAAVLYDIESGRAHTTFDNSECNAAWRDLFDAIQALVSWMSSAGAPDGPREDVYRIAPAEGRVGGYEAFSAERREGIELSQKVQTAWEALEKAANEARLFTPPEAQV